jgi:hypothetical protein
MKFFQIICFILLLPSLSSAQNLSGVWEGQSNEGPMRLVILQRGDSCFGYIFERSMGQCTAHFEGSYNTDKKELNGSSPGFIQKDFGHGLARYKLAYDTADGIEKFTGTAKAKSTAAQIASFGMTLHCVLYRTNKIPDTTEFMRAALERNKSESPAFTAAAVAVSTADNVYNTATTPLSNRPAEVLHTITAMADTIQCTIYDNAVFDHDTVTVIHNGTVIINAAEISTKPLRFEIRLSKEEPFHEIVFYANNLGDIPPNTGLLIIETKEKRYALDFTADMKTNGKIVVRLRE